MKRDVCFVLLTLVLSLALFGISCGGGGGGEKLVELCLVEYDHWEKTEPPDPDMSNLAGTYALHSFDVDVWMDGVHLLVISSDQFASFSGTLVMTSDTMTESITVEGETAGFTGTYSVSNSSDYSGTLHVVVESETLDLVCAMGPITICGQSSCEDFFLLTIQSEMICEMVPEDELTAGAAQLQGGSIFRAP